MKAGWKTVKLGEAAKIISGRNQREVESPNGPHPIIGSGGEMGRANETLCPADTTVIGRKGSINRPFFMSEPFWNVDTAFGISADRGVITPRFLHYFCLSFDFTTLNKGTTIPSLVKSDIAEIPIPLPPLAEQKRIVALLDETFAGIDAAKAKAKANMDEAKAVLQSHLEFVFEKGGPDWVEEPLSECLDLITYGFTNPMPTTTEGPYMITAKNIVGGRIDYESSRRTSHQAFDSLLTDKSRPKVGDVLLTKDGTLGRVAVVDRPDICVNQSVAVLRMNGKVFPPFMRDLLSSYGYQKRMIEDAGGTTIKHIYITRVDKMPVKFPASITDQKKLVDALEMAATEAQKLLNVFEKKVSAYGQLKKSLLSQAFAGELTA